MYHFHNDNRCEIISKLGKFMLKSYKKQHATQM